MSVESALSLYVLIDEVTREVLVAAGDVSGFFVDLEGQSPEVVFRGVHELDERRTRAEDAVLEIRNWRREKIGEYFIGRAVRDRSQTGSAHGPALNTSFRQFGNRCEYPEAAKIWRYWASDVDSRRGEWTRWPAESQDGWLHVVQNSWFTTGRSAGRYGDEESIFSTVPRCAMVSNSIARSAKL